jgi:hypothetical protein
LHYYSVLLPIKRHSSQQLDYLFDNWLSHYPNLDVPTELELLVLLQEAVVEHQPIKMLAVAVNYLPFHL